MSELYGDGQRALQDQFETRKLADRVEGIIVETEVSEQHQGFIESRDFFFLSTVNASGHPTVSYKGGAPGFVRVIDPKTLVFPSFDGNGMFLSMGNISMTNKIGMLFIDFENPHRARVQATASVSADDPLLSSFPGAELIVRATVDQIFINCPRYIHKHKRIESSHYVPDADGKAPLPRWKQIDIVQDALAPKDQGRADERGGVIDFETYAEKVKAGDG